MTFYNVLNLCWHNLKCIKLLFDCRKQEMLLLDCSILQKDSNYWLFIFQQHCRTETLVSSMQKSSSAQELKEETSQFPASSISLERGRSSVRKNVKMQIFLLIQRRSPLRMADTASNIKKELFQYLLQFWMWASQIWLSLTQDGTNVVCTDLTHPNHHTARLRSELKMVSFYWESWH